MGVLACLLCQSSCCDIDGVLSLSGHPVRSEDDMETASSFIVLLLFLFAYLLPSVVAYLRSHNDGKAITILNLILGFTVIGWVAALIWSLTGNIKKQC